MISDSDLMKTKDAMIWAKGFVERKKDNGWSLNDIDEGLMVCWFANAMAAQEFVRDDDQSLSRPEVQDELKVA